MSEPCTIYSTRRKPFAVAEIAVWSDGARMEADGAEEQWSTITLTWGDGSETVVHGDQRSDLAEHLDGFRGYVWKCAGEMSQPVYALLQRILQVRNVYGTTTGPQISAPAEALVKRMASEGCGLIFRGNAVFNSDLELLVEPERVAKSHRVKYWPAAEARRARTVSLLQSRGLRTPESLPPVPGEEEVLLRTPQEVGYRALALFAVASRAVPNGIGRGEAWRLLKGVEDCLSPNEHAFLKSFFPGNEDRVNFSWRFEALAVLLWAAGFLETLGVPEQVQEAPELGGLIKQLGFESLLNPTSLRPTSEILDQLDLVYRCHWLTADCRVQQKPMPSGIEPGVVMERHHALNWLTCYEGAEWDEVRTDT